MAQVVKTVPTAAPTPVSGVRQPAGARSVATVDAAPIEEVSPKAGVSYEETGFLFQDYGQGGHFQDRNRGPIRNPLTYGVNATSQTFAAIFEVAQATRSGGTGGGLGAAFVAGLLSKAIDIYESNAKVIAGTEAVRGGTLSISL
jgi:hypothetical protein